MLDFIRIACAVPAVKVGDVRKNTEDICAYMEKADSANADFTFGGRFLLHLRGKGIIFYLVRV